VLPPSGLVGAGVTEPLAIDYQAVENARVEAVTTQTRQSLRDIDPSADGWPLTIETGNFARLAARVAHELAATHIVLGSGRHDRLHRWLGTEEVPRIAQLAHIPIVAVPRTSTARPRRIVVATDLSDFARDALQSAVDIATPGARVELVHVVGPVGSLDLPLVDADTPEFQEEIRSRFRADLKRWAEGSNFPGSREIGFNILEGDTIEEIFGFAERGGADMIAVGSHGFGFFGRVMLGSVSTALVRGADCIVLIAPPREPAQELVQRP
jgi:nucleotide-binding universal stress UspA family protein